MSDPVELPDPQSSDDLDGDDPGWPLSFLVLVVAGGLYLILRFFQMGKDLFS